MNPYDLKLLEAKANRLAQKVIALQDAKALVVSQLRAADKELEAIEEQIYNQKQIRMF